MKASNGVDLSTGLVTAVTQVLASTTNLEPKLTELQEGNPKRIHADVSALIVVTGSTLSGSVVLHCSGQLANIFAQTMLGEPVPENPPTEVNDEVRDAMGEIANISVGSFKTSLSSCVGEAVRMSVPTVIVGHHHTTQTLSGGNWCAAHFNVAGHPLIVEMVLKLE